MEKLTTTTGKEFECDYFVTIPYPQQTYFRIKNTPIDTVAKVFSDSRETNEDKPETLVQQFDEPADVAILDGALTSIIPCSLLPAIERINLSCA